MEVIRYQKPQQLKSSSSESVCGGTDHEDDKAICCQRPPRPVGFRFIPEEHHLIYYLQKKYNNPNARFPLIHETNIYDDRCHPKELLESYATEGVLYILSPRFRRCRNGKRPRRETKRGTWKANTSVENIVHEGVVIGKKSSLVYHPGPEGTNWTVFEYWIPKYQKKLHEHRIDEPMDRFVMYKLYSTKDPARKRKISAGRKRVQNPSSSVEELPAKKLAQGGRKRVQSSVEELPGAKELAQGGCHGREEVQVASNVHSRQQHDTIAQEGKYYYNTQVTTGQTQHYNHSLSSQYLQRNEVQNKEEEYHNEQVSNDCDYIMKSGYYSDGNFQEAGSSNSLFMQKYPIEPPRGTFSYLTFMNLNPGPKITHPSYNGPANNNIVGCYNGLQGGDSGGGLGSCDSGLPPLPGNSGGGFGRLECGYNIYSNSTQVYSNIAPVPGHPPLRKEYQPELSPY